jgi:hypothetical protein
MTIEDDRRKAQPIARGVIDYFPDALLALAELSRRGNEQHHPGAPLHWSYHQSAQHADSLMRHFIDRHSDDTDGVPHVVKVAWRALAMLQTHLEHADPALHARREERRVAAKSGL